MTTKFSITEKEIPSYVRHGDEEELFTWLEVSGMPALAASFRALLSRVREEVQADTEADYNDNLSRLQKKIDRAFDAASNEEPYTVICDLLEEDR